MVFEDQLQGQGVERLTITVQFCQNDLISTLHVPHAKNTINYKLRKEESNGQKIGSSQHKPSIIAE